MASLAIVVKHRQRHPRNPGLTHPTRLTAAAKGVPQTAVHLQRRRTKDGRARRVLVCSARHYYDLDMVARESDVVNSRNVEAG
jgi:hypothetical protein